MKLIGPAGALCVYVHFLRIHAQNGKNALQKWQWALRMGKLKNNEIGRARSSEQCNRKFREIFNFVMLLLSVNAI